MLDSTRTVGCVLVGAATVALAASCTQNASHTPRVSRQSDRVIGPQHADPFAPLANDDPFTHPVTIPAVAGAPPISIFGDLPNTGAATQPPSNSLDETHNLRQVTFAPEGSDFDPAPSHDAKRIFFASTRHRATSDIYVQNVGGSAVTQLTSDPAHDVMPSVSPDDARIAFSSNRNGSWDIYVMSTDGGQAIQITSDSAHELHPSWSPDGTMIAYCRLGEASDRWEIWVADVTRPASHTFLTYGLFPQWHPKDNRILFQRSRDRGDRYFSLWTVDYQNGEATAPTEVISSASAAIINPAWSPDGRFIACATVIEPDSSQARPGPQAIPAFSDIWLISADGRARTNLTGGWRFNSMPSWGGDGSIFFVSDRGGPAEIWSIQPTQAINVAGLGTPNQDPSMATVQDSDPND